MPRKLDCVIIPPEYFPTEPEPTDEEVRQAIEEERAARAADKVPPSTMKQVQVKIGTISGLPESAAWSLSCKAVSMVARSERDHFPAAETRETLQSIKNHAVALREELLELAKHNGDANYLLDLASELLFKEKGGDLSNKWNEFFVVQPNWAAEYILAETRTARLHNQGNRHQPRRGDGYAGLESVFGPHYGR
jgi:hypothetical protein